MSDDGVVNDYGWASQWTDGQLRASGAKAYKGGRHWRDYNDLQILSAAQIEGESPDNPGLLRISYHTGLHGKCEADVENWDDPATKAGFCDHVRGFVKSKTSRSGAQHLGMTRDQLDQRNRALNEGRAPEQWSNDPMQLLNANGVPMAPAQPQPSAVPTAAPAADPVAALQQQLTTQYRNLESQKAQYEQALNQINVQLATLEQQLGAINAAAAASAALQPPQPIAVPATQVPVPSAPSLAVPTAQPAPATAPAEPTQATPAPVVEPAQRVAVDIGEQSPEEEPALSPEPPPIVQDIGLPEGL